MNFFQKTKEYLAGVIAESKRVTWPGRHELWESTLVVISFIFILAITTCVCDEVIKFCLDLVRPGSIGG